MSYLKEFLLHWTRMRLSEWLFFVASLVLGGLFVAMDFGVAAMVVMGLLVLNAVNSFVVIREYRALKEKPYAETLSDSEHNLMRMAQISLMNRWSVKVRWLGTVLDFDPHVKSFAQTILERVYAIQEQLSFEKLAEKDVIQKVEYDINTLTAYVREVAGVVMQEFDHEFTDKDLRATIFGFLKVDALLEKVMATHGEAFANAPAPEQQRMLAAQAKAMKRWEEIPISETLLVSLALQRMADKLS